MRFYLEPMMKQSVKSPSAKTKKSPGAIGSEATPVVPKRKRRPTIPIPASTMVAGHEIPVRLRKNLYEKEGARGYWDTVKREIAIDYREKGTYLGEVYIHELCHAISSIYGLGLKEQQVDKLGLGLHQALTNGVGRAK
jgi:hypothetical protein